MKTLRALLPSRATLADVATDVATSIGEFIRALLRMIQRSALQALWLTPVLMVAAVIASTPDLHTIHVLNEPLAQVRLADLLPSRAALRTGYEATFMIVFMYRLTRFMIGL